MYNRQSHCRPDQTINIPENNHTSQKGLVPVKRDANGGDVKMAEILSNMANYGRRRAIIYTTTGSRKALTAQFAGRKFANMADQFWLDFFKNILA